MTAMPPESDYSPPERSGLTSTPHAFQASASASSSSPPPASEPGLPVADPDVAAAVRLLHRNQGWNRAAITSILAFFVACGAYANAESQGAPAPSWFLGMIIALGGLIAVSIMAVVVYSAQLRHMPPAVRAQATPIAAHHPSRLYAHHYPPRHLVTWALRWVGMLVILVVAVVSVPAVVDGVAYMFDAGRTATFDPVSYQTYCRYSCSTITDGILETGGAGVSASWQNVVPLGRPFQVREPVWTWGLGAALIDSDKTAVIAVVVSLLIEGLAVLVVVKLFRLARNWRWHRRSAPTSVSIP